MKVLYLCTDPGIDVAGQGGGSIHIRALVRSLTQSGHSVTLVCSSAGAPGLHEETRAAIRPAPLSRWNRALRWLTQVASRIACRPLRQHPDLVRILHNLTFARAALAAIREERPDFIYERYSLWSLTGVTIARKWGIPIVLEVNAPLVYEQSRYRGLWLPALAARIERRIWRRADLLLAVSDQVRLHLDLAGIPAARIAVSPNGVDCARFEQDAERDAARARLNIAGRFVIGLVGTFKPWHGTDVLLDAFEELWRDGGDVHLLLVGDGPGRPQAERRIRAAGLERAVTITGNVPHSEVPKYVIAMDAAVVPSPVLDQNYYSPLKLFEYMAAGRAIVASRAGQLADILVDGETGLLCEPGNAQELANCLRKVRDNVALRCELGENARKACRSYTWDGNAARVIERARPLVQARLSSPGRKEDTSIDSVVTRV